MVTEEDHSPPPYKTVTSHSQSRICCPQSQPFAHLVTALRILVVGLQVLRRKAQIRSEVGNID